MTRMVRRGERQIVVEAFCQTPYSVLDTSTATPRAPQPQRLVTHTELY